MTVLCVLSWIQTNTKSQMNLERSNIHKSENLKIEFQTIFQGHNSSFNFNACWQSFILLIQAGGYREQRNNGEEM